MPKEDVIRKILGILHCHLNANYHIDLIIFIITTLKSHLYYNFL